MRLKKKYTIFFIIQIFITGLLILTFMSISLSQVFREIEQNYIEKNLFRFLRGVVKEQLELSSLSRDWAIWDEAFGYGLKNGAPEVMNYLNNNIMAAQELDLVLYIDSGGKPVLNTSSEKTDISEASAAGALNGAGQIFPLDNYSEAAAGYQMIDEELFLLSYNPIYQGGIIDPNGGIVILGRLYDSEKWRTIEDAYSGEIRILTPEEGRKLTEGLESHPLEARKTLHYLIDFSSSDTLYGYILLDQIDGSPAFYIQARMKRYINISGRRTFTALLLTTIAVLFIFLFAGRLGLKKILFTRLHDLENQVGTIAPENGLNNKIRLTGSDELNILADGLNNMLYRLISTQAELSEINSRNKALSAIIEQSPTPTLLFSASGNIEYKNPAFMELFGCLPLEKIISKTDSQILDHLEDAVMNSSTLKKDCHINLPDGETLWMEVLFTPVYSQESDQTQLAGYFSNINERIRKENRIHHEAMHDSLTQLPNRAFLQQQLSGLIEKQDPILLLFMDLDGFKPVNDNFGHSEGDEILKMVSKRLVKCLRDNDFIARLGGDEFCILLEGGKDAIKISERIQNTFESAFVTATHSHDLGVSIGICSFPEDGNSAAELIKNADQAMYQAKNDGKGRISYFRKSVESL